MSEIKTGNVRAEGGYVIITPEMETEFRSRVSPAILRHVDEHTIGPIFLGPVAEAYERLKEQFGQQVAERRIIVGLEKWQRGQTEKMYGPHHPQAMETLFDVDPSDRYGEGQSHPPVQGKASRRGRVSRPAKSKTRDICA